MIKNIQINDKQLVCMFCGNETFDEVKTFMNRRFLAMFDWEMLNLLSKRGSGKAYVCSKCGYKHEFFSDLPKNMAERISELNPLS